MKYIRSILLTFYRLGYEKAFLKLIFRSSAQDAHDRILRLLSWADGSSPLCALFDAVNFIVMRSNRIWVGGEWLESEFILAAGFVKGEGFESEVAALAAVEVGHNIMPGWRSMPRLVGLVEYGSFTRYPRVGNPGVVMWRDESTQSTQNRVGLRNPGAIAAAAFLAKNRAQLPEQFGINIAVSPGVSDLNQTCREMIEAVDAFLQQQIIPTWFTLNISCPNTEDDPGGRQTEAIAREVCSSVVEHLEAQNYNIPIWVKVSPDLSAEQYRILIRVFEDVGISAVVATNTLAQPTPIDASVLAGVGGGRLHRAAMEAAAILAEEKRQNNYRIDVIGCGGVVDGQSYRDYCMNGIHTVQYWSALIYRGPLAAAVIQHEIEHES